MFEEHGDLNQNFNWSLLGIEKNEEKKQEKNDLKPLAVNDRLIVINEVENKEMIEVALSKKELLYNKNITLKDIIEFYQLYKIETLSKLSHLIDNVDFIFESETRLNRIFFDEILEHLGLKKPENIFKHPENEKQTIKKENHNSIKYKLFDLVDGKLIDNYILKSYLSKNGKNINSEIELNKKAIDNLKVKILKFKKDNFLLSKKETLSIINLFLNQLSKSQDFNIDSFKRNNDIIKIFTKGIKFRPTGVISEKIKNELLQKCIDIKTELLKIE
tara:strand:+ start:347 stop:1168 length:822 start_codon:yes stop_codon:yes gene_type:complete